MTSEAASNSPQTLAVVDSTAVTTAYMGFDIDQGSAVFSQAENDRFYYSNENLAVANGTVVEVRYHANATGDIYFFSMDPATEVVTGASGLVTVSTTGSIQSATVNFPVNSGDVIAMWSPTGGAVMNRSTDVAPAAGYWYGPNAEAAPVASETRGNATQSANVHGIMIEATYEY